MSLQTPPETCPTVGCLTPQERIMRTSNIYGDSATPAEPSCSKDISVSIFFDGTNNNLDRDTQDNSHSNIVVLFKAHKDNKLGDYYPIYIPGVGTEFSKIGEMHESTEGKSMAKGGEPRIHYAMIQIYNAVHQAVHKDGLPIVNRDDALADVTSYSKLKSSPLAVEGEKRRAYFGALETRLKSALINIGKPEVKKINLSIFGFSRGAAQARAFSNWMVECCKGDGSTFCGIPITFQFLGIFDTVASVGLADSSPIGDGLMDWADGTMEIPKAVKRTVHLVAAHEVRQNFPLSSARSGKAYPGNCIEVVYPGAHSDVGGGYGAGDQGKAAEGRSYMASQVPLVHMYQEAMKAGVQFLTVPELKKLNRLDTISDIQIHPTLTQRFEEYIKWSKIAPAPVDGFLFDSMKLYWRWRVRVTPTFEKLSCFQRADGQGKADLLASQKEFEAQMAHVRKNKELESRKPAFPPSDGMPQAPYTPTEAEDAVLQEQDKPQDLPPVVHDFFDHHIHDSHASFHLRGPTSKEEISNTVNKVKDRKAALDKQGKAEPRGLWDDPSSPPEQRIEPLSALEQRILDQDAIKPGSFPVLTDADIPDLKKMESFMTNAALWLINATLRESGTFVRRRRVFTKS